MLIEALQSIYHPRCVVVRSCVVFSAGKKKGSRRVADAAVPELVRSVERAGDGRGIGNERRGGHARTTTKNEKFFLIRKEARPSSSRARAASLFFFSRRRRRLNPLLARLTQLHLTTPLGLQHLARRDATARIRVEDGVDDISAAGLSIS